MLIDAHNHLQDEALIPHREAIVRVLENTGVSCAVVNGTCENDWSEVRALADSYGWVVPSYGLHPWFVASRSPEWLEMLTSFLDAELEQGRCVGVGEIGLDRWKKPFDFEDQQTVFLQQLSAACARDVPVTIHCLEAWGPLEKLLRSHPVPSRGFLVHAFGGSVEMARALTDLGAYFSFSGYFLHERKHARRDVFRSIPLDRLLVETDAPAMCLPPEEKRFSLPLSPNGEEVNHPSNIQVVYEALAELRGLSLERLTAQVEGNFNRLFRRGELAPSLNSGVVFD